MAAPGQQARSDDLFPLLHTDEPTPGVLSQLWALWYKREVDILERLQPRTMNMMDYSLSPMRKG